MSFFSMRLVGILLLFIALHATGTSCSETDKPQIIPDNGIFGHFSVLGLIITLIFVIIIIGATAVAGIVDFKGHSTQDFEKFDTDPDQLIQDWIENTQTPSKAQQSGGSERSTEDNSTKAPSPIKTADLINDHNFLRKPEVSSRLHAEEKHARVIEAIYHASGRELPDQYKAGRNIYLLAAPTQPNSPNASEMEKTQVAPTTVLSVINEVPTDPVTDTTGASLVSDRSHGLSAKSVAKIVASTATRTEKEKQADLARIQSETDVEITKSSNKATSATLNVAATQAGSTSKSVVEVSQAGSVPAPKLIPGVTSLEDLKKKEMTTPLLLEVDRTPMPSDREVEECKENESVMSVKDEEGKKKKK